MTASHSSIKFEKSAAIDECPQGNLLLATYSEIKKNFLTLILFNSTKFPKNEKPHNSMVNNVQVFFAFQVKFGGV